MITETIKKFVGRLFAPAPRGPLRITRDKHGIDRRNVSRHAIKVCEVLRQHGYEGYIVGGAVRDLIVGLEPKDFDVATNATPEQIRPLFRRKAEPVVLTWTNLIVLRDVVAVGRQDGP